MTDWPAPDAYADRDRLETTLDAALAGTEFSQPYRVLVALWHETRAGLIRDLTRQYGPKAAKEQPALVFVEEREEAGQRVMLEVGE